MKFLSLLAKSILNVNENKIQIGVIVDYNQWTILFFLVLICILSLIYIASTYYNSRVVFACLHGIPAESRPIQASLYVDNV